MQFVKFERAKNAATGLWQSLLGLRDADRGYDPYERSPVTHSEMAGTGVSDDRRDDRESYSSGETSEHQALGTLRNILYPPDHA